MNYTQQFNQEFDRIFSLMIKTIPNSTMLYLYDGRVWEFSHKINQKQWQLFTLFGKIDWLHSLFTAKNEKGEWVLNQANDEIVLLKNMSKIDPWNGNIQSRPIIWKNITTLRDLFLANCIPSNDEDQDEIKIENLKLINW